MRERGYKMQNLLKTLEKLLANNDEFVVNGKLIKNKIVEKGLALDSGLIGLLLSDDTMKAQFFTDVSGVLVFDQLKFQRFVSNKAFLPDSYTSFKNKIGLTDRAGNELNKNKDVVLSWAYKDCVLEGGQDKEDAKRDEIFYNETLAPDDITRLFDTKVLTGFEYWDKTAVEKNVPSDIKNFNRDEKGVIKDNLLIKGNNLLVLHTLKSEFAGKVKLIYIDPPYNTGSDSFGYNDSFNHSTWLTFMKNRLEIAKQLLSNDGVIFVQIDDNEQAYLKVLMDEVFGRENFESVITWRRRHNQPNDSTKMIAKVSENIIVFAKNSSSLKETCGFYTLPLSQDRQTDYSNPDNDPRGPWSTTPWKTSTNQGGSEYEITTPSGKVYKEVWMGSVDTFNQLMKENLIVFSNNGKGLPRKKIFLSERVKGGQPATNFWVHTDFGSNQEGSAEIDTLFGKGFFANPKPERLMKAIIEISTRPGDIVLDYHSGSGTTLAVAHKMGRQWIGVEQLDYIKDLPEARLKKVIDGENGGVSQEVNWKGGGSFVYCRLMERNEVYIPKIRAAKTTDELQEIYADMKENAVLHYDYDKSEHDNLDLDELTINEQKSILLNLLNKNHLYVLQTEINDPSYSVSDSDKILNKDFFKTLYKEWEK